MHDWERVRILPATSRDAQRGRFLRRGWQESERAGMSHLFQSMRALVDSRISTRLAGSEALCTMTVVTDERTGESPCRQARPAVDDHDNVKLSEHFQTRSYNSLMQAVL